jgi:hypothetical protein
MYSALISVSNRPPLSVTAQSQPSCFLCCNVVEEAKVSEAQTHGNFRSLQVYGKCEVPVELAHLAEGHFSLTGRGHY